MPSLAAARTVSVEHSLPPRFADISFKHEVLPLLDRDHPCKEYGRRRHFHRYFRICRSVWDDLPDSVEIGGTYVGNVATRGCRRKEYGIHI
jgi:hypothetical protein